MKRIKMIIIGVQIMLPSLRLLYTDIFMIVPVDNDLYDKMLVICRTMSLFILLEHFEVLVLKVGL